MEAHGANAYVLRCRVRAAAAQHRSAPDSCAFSSRWRGFFLAWATLAATGQHIGVEAREVSLKDQERGITQKELSLEQQRKAGAKRGAVVGTSYNLGEEWMSLWSRALKEQAPKEDLTKYLQSSRTRLQYVEQNMDPEVVPGEQLRMLQSKLGFVCQQLGRRKDAARFYMKVTQLLIKEAKATVDCKVHAAINYNPHAHAHDAKACMQPNNVRYYANAAVLLLREVGQEKALNKLWKALVALPNIGWSDPYQTAVNFFPGLPSTPVWGTDGYHLVEALQENWRLILGDLKNVLDSFGFNAAAEAHDYLIVERGKWQEYVITPDGNFTGEKCRLVPNTCRILSERSIESSYFLDGQRSGIVSFARLDGGTHLRPHTGPTNRKITLHLPLIVPEGPLEMRVKDEVVHWEEGKVLLFDDSYEHEVWHNGTEPRYILHMSMWHPSAGATEEASVADAGASAARSTEL